ncbi:hypothetical protein LBC_00490 [Campylobacter sp. 19-13652]|nr:hypothetical protein LBC_00490 [Campylobacter sp. 19-13652]
MQKLYLCAIHLAADIFYYPRFDEIAMQGSKKSTVCSNKILENDRKLNEYYKKVTT